MWPVTEPAKKRVCHPDEILQKGITARVVCAKSGVFSDPVRLQTPFVSLVKEMVDADIASHHKTLGQNRDHQ
jgi:hypothetical protein